MGAVVLGALVLVLALAIGEPRDDQGSLTVGQGRVGPSTTRSAATPSTSGLRVIGAGPAPSAATTPQPPVRIRIPAIGVDSSLQRLALESDGSLQPPTRWAQAGWYAGGVEPGQVGPAVIAGHVDSTRGPAVFFRLKQLATGDRVRIDTQGGRSLTFEVDSVRRFAKSAFPTNVVYGAVPDPELRLITCTGTFDRAQRSYLDNLVVSAHLIG